MENCSPNLIDKLRNKRCAIYGISGSTKQILNRLSEEGIFVTGLLDGFRQEGSVFKHRIITLDETVENSISTIIIVARLVSQKIIFNRIKNFCRNNNVEIIDTYGRDLFHFYSSNTVEEKNNYIELLIQFVIWLTSNLSKKDYRYVLFISRDGYMVKKIYDILRKELYIHLPESVYFLSSRAVCAISASNNRENIEYFSNFAFDGSPEQLLSSRFMLEDECIKTFTQADYEDEFDFIMAHCEKIIEKSNIYRQNYIGYVMNNFPDILSQKNEVAIFDLISTGTCQMCLQEILGRKLDGYYAAKLDEDYAKKKSLNIKSMINDAELSVLEHYFVLELLTKDTEPSLLYFNDSKTPVYKEDSIPPTLKAKIKTLQKNILRCIEASLDKSSTNLEHLAKDVQNIMDADYLEFIRELAVHGTITDEFSNRNVKVI